MSSPTDDELYNISIETLEIPSEAIKLLKRVGMESIGDCLDFQKRGADAMIQVPYGLLDAFYAQVLPRLREHGYLTDE